MSTWWSLAPRGDLGLHASLMPSTRPFAVSNRGWYVLHRFLNQVGAPSTHLMVGPQDSFVPSRVIVQWGQLLEKLSYGDWYMLSRFNGHMVVASGIIHSGQLDTVPDDVELTALFGTPTYNWLLSIGQELTTAPSAYVITGTPRKGSPMSLELKKGQKVDVAAELGKASGVTDGGIAKFRIGAGWDARKGAGEPFDLDLFAIGCDDNGKRISDAWCVYFNQLQSPDAAIVHSGDNLTGEGDGDDETLTFDLAKVPAEVTDIRLYITIYEAKDRGNLNFGLVNKAFIRAVDETSGTEVFRYDLSEDAGPVPTVEFAKLYRDPSGKWSFKAIAEARAEEIPAIFASH